MRWLLELTVAVCVTFVLTPYAQAQTTTLMRIPGDIDGDGQVDAVDQLILSRNWHREIGQVTSEAIVVDLPDLPSSSRLLRLVRIPAGTFEMGSPGNERGRNTLEGPLHTVTIDYDFFMGETEITQAQWQAVTGSSPVSESDYGLGVNFPVYNVSWDDIAGPNGFLANLNALGQGAFRLPSEAEWEYVCRGNTQTRFNFGDSLDCDDICEDCAAGILSGNRGNHMWYCGNNTPVGARLVGLLGPGPFGVYDMHGNVQEWCQDHKHDSYFGAPTDGSAWVEPATPYRIVRGGAWNLEVAYCRSAYREWSRPEYRFNFVGFRVVRLP
jgi:formylglycine-generating enzyme required for sulfatase activity